MTSRQDWPKPDLLQQRRLELGLPLEPGPAPALLSQYGEESKQEVPQAASPLERLKQAFQDFTDSIDGGQPPVA